MKALSIRQPWAWAIIHAGKDIENRGYETKYRGDILVHASTQRIKGEYKEACDFMSLLGVYPPSPQPLANGLVADLPFGYIIGIVTLVDCQFSSSTSGWGMANQWHWKLQNPRAITPICFAGRLGLFDVPDKLLMSAEVQFSDGSVTVR